MPQTPQRRPVRERPTIERVTVVETALDWVAAAWAAGRLCALVFGHRSAEQAVRALGVTLGVRLTRVPRVSDEVFTRRLRAYAAGTPDDLADIPVQIDDLTEFQQRVVQRCRRIPYGATLSYQQLACQVGRPGAARAVGGVMARNRIPLVIPCHRVVGAGGALGGYSAPGGLATKRRLLEMEAKART